MNTLYLIFFFIFGSIMGSFYGVIGERLPKQKNFINSRSVCNDCNKTLKFIDMIPIISYLIYRGKCRYCGEKIPVLLPLLEITTGLLFAVSFYSYGMSYELLLALGVVSLLIIILVSDLLYYVIPDEIIIFFIFYFILVQFMNLGFNGVCIKIVNGLFLFLLMYFIMWLGEKIFNRECLGGGDVKLLFIFGLVLEPILGVFSIFLGSLIALPVAAVILFTNKEHMIPFGPFLLIAFALIFFSKINTYDFIRILGIY